MGRIKLNIYELEEYNNKIVSKVPNLKSGIYQFKDFFTGSVTSARIGRKFYEDVVDKKFANISLVGRRAKDGYLVI